MSAQRVGGVRRGSARAPGAGRKVMIIAAAVLLITASHVAAAPKPDPWARVPALPASCYQSSDDFHQRLAAADEALARDLASQQEINTNISEQLKSADPMTLASRQQQYMMEHPQESMELMQRYQQVGETTADTELANAEKRKQLDQELDAISGRYKTALDGALSPIQAKLTALDEKASKVGSIQSQEGNYEGRDLQEYLALLKEENTSYEKLCSEWWTSSGPYHGWLKRYREQLVGEIPEREEAESVGAGFVAIMMSTPEATWRPTAALRNVNEYMDKIAQIFAKRRLEPVKPPK